MRGIGRLSRRKILLEPEDGAYGIKHDARAALDGNPLDDIEDTQRIRGVVLNGHWLDREALDGMLARVEAVIQSLRQQTPAPSDE